MVVVTAKRVFSVAIFLLALVTGRSVPAQESLYSQPHVPSGSFLLSNQLPSHPEVVDFARSKVWDSFQLDVKSEITGVQWSGAFDGLFKPGGPRPDVDFLVEIYADEENAPGEIPIRAWLLDSGIAATDDGVDVRSQVRVGEEVVRGGSVVDYQANPLPSTEELESGKYWLSITAAQTFPNPDPAVDPVNGFFDPGWGWHIGEGGDANAISFDGFVNTTSQVNFDMSFEVFGNRLVELLLGDFDLSGVLDVGDIDLLSASIRGGTEDLTFDLNGDGVVDAADRSNWIGEIFGTLPGDADLNRTVDFTDFLRLSQNFAKQGNWGAGDFSGNGNVAFEDFLALSQNFGKSVASSQAIAVPEPSSAKLASLFVVIGFVYTRTKRRPVGMVAIRCDMAQ